VIDAALCLNVSIELERVLSGVVEQQLVALAVMYELEAQIATAIEAQATLATPGATPSIADLFAGFTTAPWRPDTLIVPPAAAGVVTMSPS
jgi:hypothetical protein